MIGARFSEDQLASLVDPVRIAELVDAELIDDMPSTPQPEYNFRYPLIRSVAYESQLQSARAELHSRLASWFQLQAPGDSGREVRSDRHARRGGGRSAGRIRVAYAGGKMGGPSQHGGGTHEAGYEHGRWRSGYPRRIRAALRMCVDATTLLCGSAWLAGLTAAETGFDDLRRLSAEIRDERSIAVGMSGMVMALAFHNRARKRPNSAPNWAHFSSASAMTNCQRRSRSPSRQPSGRPAK